MLISNLTIYFFMTQTCQTLVCLSLCELLFLSQFLTSLSDRSPCSKLSLSFNSFSSFLVQSSSSVFSRSSLSRCSFRRSMMRS